MGKNNTNLPDVFEICLLEIVQNNLHFTQIFSEAFFAFYYVKYQCTSIVVDRRSLSFKALSLTVRFKT